MQANHSGNRSIGPLLWVFNIQYYIVQFIVAAAWAKNNGYSWANNTISDLGNTQCGMYGNRLVCSPLHTAMNSSFVVLGAAMIGGALLLRRQFANNRLGVLGFSCMELAGLGTILVGLHPENTSSSIHVAGATLAFIFGNLGMILIGVSLKKMLPALRYYTILSGIIGLIALLLFITKTYAGIGIGGMERFAGYPQSIWMVIFGACLL